MGNNSHTDLQDEIQAQKENSVAAATFQRLLFFDFLWERCGDRERDLDFLEGFLGVRDLDLRDRLGVTGGEGDL